MVLSPMLPDSSCVMAQKYSDPKHEGKMFCHRHSTLKYYAIALTYVNSKQYVNDTSSEQYVIVFPSTFPVILYLVENDAFNLFF